MKEDDKEPEGLIRISAFESFGRIHVAPLLPKFLNKYPKVKVEIELDNRMVDLLSENIDIAIRIGAPVDSGLKARTLLPNHTIVCASPDYLNHFGEPQEPGDLMGHNCLLLNHDRQRIYWHFKKGRTHKKIYVQGNLISKGGTPLLEAALKGVGVLLLANWMVADYVRDGRLVVCLEDWKPSLYENMSGEIFAVYQNSKHPNPLTRLLIDYLVEHTQNKVLQ